jgi:hypothetical protein
MGGRRLVCVSNSSHGERIVGSLHHLNFFFLPDAVVLVSGLKLQVQEAGIVPEQENITVPLTFM